MVNPEHDPEAAMNRPACPDCGQRYTDFVWKSDLDDDEEPPETDCEKGIGYYIHE